MQDFTFDKRKKPWQTPICQETNAPAFRRRRIQSKESPMSIDAHLASLEKKHGELEAELRAVLSQPSVHDETIVDIKRRKLRLKDEIKRLRSDTEH
jgi:hypothetical protein